MNIDDLKQKLVAMMTGEELSFLIDSRMATWATEIASFSQRRIYYGIEGIAQSKPKAPSVFRKILSVDGKNYSIAMPMKAYTAMKEAIDSPDESGPVENVLNVAMLLFMNYVELPQPFWNPVVAVALLHQTGAGTIMRMSVRGLGAAPNMPTGYANQLENIKVHTVKYNSL